jgi:hypothetical protein
MVGSHSIGKDTPERKLPLNNEQERDFAGRTTYSGDAGEWGHGREPARQLLLRGATRIRSCREKHNDRAECANNR